tara:strand:+ start:47651 stop:49543 length:1893 start_codon:yes stop_codon:yes gene_type:complete
MATIETVINDAKAYAGDLLGEARQLVNSATLVSQGRAFVNVQDISWNTLGDANGEFAATLSPGDFSDSYLTPDSSDIEQLDLQPNYIPNTPDFPPAPATLDTSGLFSINRPDWNLADFTKAAPTINTNLQMPQAPDISLPGDPESPGSAIQVPTVTPPTFDDQLDQVALSEVDVTGRIADEFTITREQLVTAASSYADAWLTQYCPGYHDGMAELEGRISEALAGGSAMNEAWEEAIYDRAVVRVNDEQHRAQEALTVDYARRGFTIPPGAVMAGLSRIRHETARNLADVAGNIANERARLELQHLQFGMQISTTLRQHFSSAMQNYMQLVLSANGIALQYAQEIGRWAAELFNQRAEMYRLEIQRYQAEAQVYAVRLESAFAIIRQFEVQIEAERLKIDLDSNAIALYEAKIRGQQSKVDLYNARLQGLRTQLEAEAQKMSLFETEVRAYAARVSAKESEYNAYRAAIQGDTAKVDAYQAEVQAYGAQVQAAGSKVDAERAISQSINEYNRSLIDQRDSDIRKYVAEIQGESARFGSSVDAYKAALARYSTEVEARLRVVSTNYDRDKLELEAAVARVETNLRAQISNVEGYIRSIASQADITNAGANIIGDMASAALTTNNTILTSEE